jgi:hypothetical protein
VGIGGAQVPSRSQFTLHVDGPEGDGVLSLTLRLRAADRFRLTARDRVLRRQVWELALEGESALMIDHRAESYCWYGAEVELDVVPLGPLPVASLPAMLLGRLPLSPHTEIARAAGGEEVEFLDRLGRRWRVTIVGDTVRSWTLFDGREPSVWYSQAADGIRRLSARREGLQLRWRQSAFERSAEGKGEEAAALTPPVGYGLRCP